MRYRVLIAEDEAVTRRSILESLRAILPEEEFLLAENGAQAVALAEEAVELHMAFLDVKMPVLDGIQAARRIRARWSQCQIIFLTAYSDFEYMRQALDLEAVDYLLKPFSQTGLRAAVQKGQNRLAFWERTWQTGGPPEKERQTLERLAEQRLRPEQALERGEETGQAGAFTSGAFGVLCCAGAAGAQRLAGLVRGAEWEVRLKPLVSVSQNYVFLLLTSPVEEDLSRLLEARLRVLSQKAERILRVRISGVVSYPLQGTSDVEVASFYCFAALTLLQSEGGILRLKNREDMSAPQTLAPGEDICSSGAYIRALFQYFELQKFSLSMARMRAVNALERAYRACLGVQRGTEQFAPLRRELLECDDAQRLQGMLARGLDSLWAQEREERFQPEEQGDPAQRIRDYLNTYYAREITLESISADLGYSRTYFSRLFKQLFQENFVTYLTALRVEKAKALLRDTPLSVRDVARQTGFREGAYFASIFRRATGQTPREYRAGEGSAQ